MPGRGTQESGEGPGATWDGESRPESSTFSGDEEEKGEGLEVKPRLLEPGGGGGGSWCQLQTPPTWRPRPSSCGPRPLKASPTHPLRPRPLVASISTGAPPIHPQGAYTTTKAWPTHTVAPPTIPLASLHSQ